MKEEEMREVIEREFGVVGNDRQKPNEKEVGEIEIPSMSERSSVQSGIGGPDMGGRRDTMFGIGRDESFEGSLGRDEGSEVSRGQSLKRRDEGYAFDEQIFSNRL